MFSRLMCFNYLSVFLTWEKGKERRADAYLVLIRTSAMKLFRENSG